MTVTKMFNVHSLEHSHFSSVLKPHFPLRQFTLNNILCFEYGHYFSQQYLQNSCVKIILGVNYMTCWEPLGQCYKSFNGWNLWVFVNSLTLASLSSPGRSRSLPEWSIFQVHHSRVGSWPCSHILPGWKGLPWTNNVA